MTAFEMRRWLMQGRLVGVMGMRCWSGVGVGGC